MAQSPKFLNFRLHRRYNQAILNRFHCICVALVLLFFMRPVQGQTPTAASSSSPSPSSATLVVFPFENRSGAPGLQWISESFPEVLSERMSMPWLYTVPRSDRAYAFERAGVPGNVSLSRATLFRIAEQMDVDYAVLGSFTFDGETFAARAQLLDLKRLHLLPAQVESGPLVSILKVQGSLSWDLLRQIRPSLEISKENFLAQAPAIRLDAFENYIRGVLASTHEQKVRYFSEAIRRNPTYSRAILELGKTYFDAENYQQAADWFARIPATDQRAREANFYLGLSAYHLKQNDRAESAFRFVESQFPLPEISNNLGVVEYLGGDPAALGDFRKATEADPQDPDYHFNLALALARASDSAGAVRQLRDLLKLNPSDDEARALLATLTDMPNTGAAAAALPKPRLRQINSRTARRRQAKPPQASMWQVRQASSPRRESSPPTTRPRSINWPWKFKTQPSCDWRTPTLRPMPAFTWTADGRCCSRASRPRPSGIFAKLPHWTRRTSRLIPDWLEPWRRPILSRLGRKRRQLCAWETRWRRCWCWAGSTWRKINWTPAAQDVQRAVAIAPQDAAVLDLQRMIRQKTGAKGSEQ